MKGFCEGALWPEMNPLGVDALGGPLVLND